MALGVVQVGTQPGYLLLVDGLRALEHRNLTCISRLGSSIEDRGDNA